jgi:hypothetical protein
LVFLPSSDFFSLIGPILTVLASSEPSAFFQDEPLTSSFSAISFIVEAVPPFVTVVLSVTLKTRDFSLPAMVNVFALWSTAETIPWNGMARALCLAGEAEGDPALAAGEPVEDGDVDFLGIVCALSATQNASAAMHTLLMK